MTEKKLQTTTDMSEATDNLTPTDRPSAAPVCSALDGDAREDEEIASARLRADPNNNRALVALYKLCREHGLRQLVVDAPDCDGSLMAAASLRIRGNVFSFGPCAAKAC